MSKPNFGDAKKILQEKFKTFSAPCVLCIRVDSSSRMTLAKAIRDIENISIKDAAEKVKACKDSGDNFEIWIWNEDWNNEIMLKELKMAHEISGALTLMEIECEIITKFDIDYTVTEHGIKRIWKVR